MVLSQGTKLGPYEIVAPIGAGGMGEVWRARDTRLDRTVAIKTSKAQFSERFEREARAVAALNHQNICQLYDVSALPDGTGYLVMEFVEGEPLLSKAKPGPLALDRALDYAAQICDALDAAHSKKITHRDLKPDNILVTKQGVKLLDFGLAKIDKPVVGPDGETLTIGLTQQGAIMGTLHYMSPEQINGREADARSDIFSFGLVLYEMLTGKRAFSGETAASVMGAILERPAPSLGDVAPPALDRVLKKCLEKDPANRWQSARDLKAALELAAHAPVAASAPAAREVSKLPWLAAAVCGLAAAGLGLVAYRHLREVPPETTALQYTIEAPQDSAVTNLAISPDGRKLVVEAKTTSASGLWLRDLTSLEMHPLPGTEGGVGPFWSPDSQNIGFFDGASLKRTSASGGPVFTICSVKRGADGTWGQDGTILFSSGNSIVKVPASGGSPTLVKNDAIRPHFLPGTKRFHYEVPAAVEGIYLSTLDGKDSLKIGEARRAQYWEPTEGGKSGYLLQIRQRALVAQAVDPQTLSPSGDSFPVATLENFAGRQGLVYSISRNGTLVFSGVAGDTNGQQLYWRDRAGKRSEAVGGAMVDFMLSANAKKVAIERPRASGGSDLWVMDLEHKTESRLTFDESSRAFTPVWSPDSTQLAYNYQAKAAFRRSADGSSQEKLILENVVPFDWTRDGKFIIVNARTSYLAVPVAGGKPVEFLPYRPGLSRFQVSPDGRWVAYTSTESGRIEVYVKPFTPAYEKPPAGKWQISTSGGSSPRWRGDGKELFYQALDTKIMAVSTHPEGPSFEYSTPKELFATEVNRNLITTGGGFPYAVTPDGQRFLLRETSEKKADKQNLVVWVNWLAGAKH